MPRIIRIRLRLLVALLLTAVLVSTDAGDLSGECTVYDRYGLQRDCTFTEEFGQCAWNSVDSYWQCIHQADEAYDRGTLSFGFAATSCELGLYADVLMCGVTSPIKTLLQ